MDSDSVDLVRRLQERFPLVPADQVRRVVETALHRFVGRPIQDFTPVLVEHAAVEALREHHPGTGAATT